MKLTYWPITRNIVRCHLDTSAEVTIRPSLGTREGSSATHYHCREWNMSATIACISEFRIGDATAIIQWQDGGTLVKTSGDLDVEFEQLREARKGGPEMNTHTCTLYQTIGARIKTAREEAGLSQHELAARIGIHRPSLTLIEQGTQKCAIHELLAIANTLRVSACWLLLAAPTSKERGEP
jgi:DNA-binding XRE family transcriptional regulator